LKNKGIKHLVLNAKNHEREADIIANAGKKNSIIITTSISGRGVDIKLGGKEKNNNEKEDIKKIGGLFILGTERMESRRVDNQARGRSGRQGDEGSSIFYVSLEDDLMRIFGSESMNNMLQKLGLKDGESIDHPWINKALERAQQKVEARNFDIRKTLLKFDDVLNDQRKVIFGERNKVIDNENNNYAEDFLDQIIIELIKDKENYLANPKNNILKTKINNIFGNAFNDIKIQEVSSMNNEDFTKEIKDKFLEKKENRLKLIGDVQNNDLEKRIFLQTIDQNWKNHIQYLEQLRQVIGLRSYGNRDPLIEYKKEAYNLFENLLSKLKTDLIKILFNLSVVKTPDELNKLDIKKNNIKNKIQDKKIGRNDICFCGSNKKYKHCCGSL